MLIENSPNLIAIVVTKRYLKRYNYERPQACPLFKILKDQGFPVAHVGGSVAFINGKGYYIFEEHELAEITSTKEKDILIHLLKL